MGVNHVLWSGKVEAVREKSKTYLNFWYKSGQLNSEEHECKKNMKPHGKFCLEK